MSTKKMPHPSKPARLEWHPRYRATAFLWLYGRAVESAGRALRKGEREEDIGACTTPEDELWTLTTSAGYGRDSAAIAAGWARGLVRCVRSGMGREP